MLSQCPFPHDFFPTYFALILRISALPRRMRCVVVSVDRWLVVEHHVTQLTLQTTRKQRKHSTRRVSMRRLVVSAHRWLVAEYHVTQLTLDSGPRPHLHRQQLICREDAHIQWRHYSYWTQRSYTAALQLLSTVFVEWYQNNYTLTVRCSYRFSHVHMRAPTFTVLF